MSRFRKALKNEEGLSTIELIISAALGLVIAAGIFTIFVNVQQASVISNDRSLSTSTAQSTSASLVSLLRNADQVKVNPYSASDKRQVVTARIAPANAGDPWKCATWVFGVTSGRGEDAVMQRTSSAAVPIPSTATSEKWDNWGALATGVKGNLSGGPAFIEANSAGLVNFSFTITKSKEVQPISFSNSVLLGAAGTSTLNCSL